jgi:serine/threonine protein kinase
MTRISRQRVKEIIDSALEQPPAERAAYLDAACGEDANVRAEVQSLLDAHDRHGAFLETPVISQPVDLDEIGRWANPDRLLLGEQIKGWQLHRIIASGGMGTVYEASRGENDDVVAIKLLRFGRNSESAQRRFVHEASVLSRLDHRGIARIFDVGSHDTGMGEVPFFAMEYVRDALPLTEYATAHGLNTQERLGLFIEVCQAVEHGHQKGIVHRDLKPANILVDAEGRTKVIDFGVAHATDNDLAATSLHTRSGELIGTLPYMSPEQCAGDPDDIDTRSDVYSLGVVLFDLLTGSLPYDLCGIPIPDAMQIIREHSPTRPSSQDDSLSGDLDTIVLTALEKDRERRYQSAAGLASDIRRHLQHEPILARPASALYHLSKFAQRNRALVAASGLVLIALVAATAISSVLAVRENAARATSEQKNAGLQAVNELMRGIFHTATPPEAQGREVTVREALDRASSRIGDEFADTPLVEATIRHAIGVAYLHLSEYEQAHIHLVTAVDIRRGLLGDEHPDTVDALVKLASATVSLGRTPDGIDQLKKAIVVLRRVHGDSHEDVITAKNQLVLALYADGRYEEAIPIAEEVVAKAHLVEPGADYESGFDGPARNSLAMVLYGAGRYADAAVIYRELYEEATSDGPSDHPGVIAVMNNLGTILVRLERYDEAMEILSETVDAADRVFGPNHDNAMRVLHAYGSLCHHLGRHEEAEPIMLDLLERRTRVLGREHLLTTSSMQAIAVLYQVMPGRLEEAEPYLVDALSIHEANDRADHPNAIATRDSLAVQYRRTGRLEESEALFEENLDLSRRVHGGDHPSTLLYLSHYARLLGDRGRHQEAGALWTETLEAMRRVHGTEHRLTREAMFMTGENYARLADYEEALVYLQEAYEADLRAEVEDHADTVATTLELANTLRLAGRYEEAEPYYLAGVASSHRVHGDEHWEHGRTLVRYGEYLLDLEQFEDAERRLLDGYARIEPTKGAADSTRRRAMRAIIELYDAWEKPEEAGAWRERLEAFSGDGGG